MTPEFKGIGLRIGATFFFTVMVLFVKWLSDAIPVGQVVFYRSAFALIPLVLFLMWTRDFPGGLRTARPMGHVARCLLGCVAMFASFASLKYLPLAHASIIGYLAPVIAVVLARVMLGEHVTGARWFGVVFGFLGMLVMVLPEAAGAEADRSYLIGVALALLMAVFTAGAKIQIRSLALTENAGAIAFYFAATCALAGLATWPYGWADPTPEQLACLVGAGASGGVAHIMMTLSLQHSEVSKLAPFEYLSLIFAVIADVAFFGIVPGLAFYAATMFIVLATSAVAFQDLGASIRRRLRLRQV
ncbi:DMT family transporter [Actibacterium ureilyticum]|uniref:DMT family transporter n=1 Tax=Actibacterium ureilyticum TaxID=1590614 RepID=UPI000BAAD7CB|nr:DMT family transporter [Actibacterium ureilyticum]